MSMLFERRRLLQWLGGRFAVSALRVPRIPRSNRPILVHSLRPQISNIRVLSLETWFEGVKTGSLAEWWTRRRGRLAYGRRLKMTGANHMDLSRHFRLGSIAMLHKSSRRPRSCRVSQISFSGTSGVWRRSLLRFVTIFVKAINPLRYNSAPHLWGSRRSSPRANFVFLSAHGGCILLLLHPWSGDERELHRIPKGQVCAS
jgi:hypothetical protein